MSDEARQQQAEAQRYDGIAAAYDQAHVHLSGDGWVRSAFHQFVEERVAPGSRLLDFGCGTGTDALHFASRGFQVQAYDPSAGMVAQLRAKGTGALSRGQVDAWTVPFVDFAPSAQGRPQVHAVLANFAVVNLFPALEPLFETWRERLLPGGLVLFSSLNPLHWKLWRRRGWWSSSVRDWRAEALRYDGAHRHWPSRVHAAAQAHFEPVAEAGAGAFIRYARGRNEWGQARSLAERAERRLWKAWPVRELGLFHFYAFRWSR